MTTTLEYVAGTERLLLRPLTEADLPTVGEWLAEPAIARSYLASAESFGIEDVQGALQWAREEETVDAWAIEHRDGGLVASSNTRPDFPWLSVYECEVTLSPDLPRRQGYGLEAHHLVVDHVFERRSSAAKAMGRAASFNGAAIAIMERLGCSLEGRLRRHVELEGEQFDLVIYGLLREEWERTGATERRFSIPAV